MKPPISRNRPPGRAPGLRHPWLYALPQGRMPAAVDCRGVRYERVRVFKHDFFAATGLYISPEGQAAVLKLNRLNPLAGLRMDWVGVFLVRREIAMYQRMAGVPGVPALMGPVGRTGLLHTYVPGHPLGRRERVGDGFFEELAELLRQMHVRRIAFADLNKRENILVGDDGRPYLLDFQISLYVPPAGWRSARPFRWLLARLQQADWYHYLKHKRRLRPDLLTEEEETRVKRLSIWIRIHRLVARPLTRLRRRALSRLRRSETVHVAGSTAK